MSETEDVSSSNADIYTSSNAGKRKAACMDPDYEDLTTQQAKRQLIIEENAQQETIVAIKRIISHHFKRDCDSKESEIMHGDKMMREAQKMLDKLRAVSVARYYAKKLMDPGKAHNYLNKPPPSIHPAAKKYLGKAPVSAEVKQEQSNVPSLQSSCRSALPESPPKTNAHIHYSAMLDQKDSLPTNPEASSVSDSTTKVEDEPWCPWLKRTIVVGNSSRYILSSQRSKHNPSTHKWMVYVRGPRDKPDISDIVSKVLFLLHPTYKPHDMVEVSEPPFHLSRLGWGEFPVRVQLHFRDPRNKRVDIIHRLKLDKTYTGLQTLGAETEVKVDLIRDPLPSLGRSKVSVKPSTQEPIVETTIRHGPEENLQRMVTQCQCGSSSADNHLCRCGRTTVTAPVEIISHRDVMRDADVTMKEKPTDHDAYSQSMNMTEIPVGKNQNVDSMKQLNIEAGSVPSTHDGSVCKTDAILNDVLYHMFESGATEPPKSAKVPSATGKKPVKLLLVQSTPSPRQGVGPGTSLLTGSYAQKVVGGKVNVMPPRPLMKVTSQGLRPVTMAKPMRSLLGVQTQPGVRPASTPKPMTSLLGVQTQPGVQPASTPKPMRSLLGVQTRPSVRPASTPKPMTSLLGVQTQPGVRPASTPKPMRSLLGLPSLPGVRPASSPKPVTSLLGVQTQPAVRPASTPKPVTSLLGVQSQFGVQQFPATAPQTSLQNVQKQPGLGLVPATKSQTLPPAATISLLNKPRASNHSVIGHHPPTVVAPGATPRPPVIIQSSQTNSSGPSQPRPHVRSLLRTAAKPEIKAMLKNQAAQVLASPVVSNTLAKASVPLSQVAVLDDSKLKPSESYVTTDINGQKFYLKVDNPTRPIQATKAVVDSEPVVPLSGVSMLSAKDNLSGLNVSLPMRSASPSPLSSVSLSDQVILLQKNPTINPLHQKSAVQNTVLSSGIVNHKVCQSSAALELSTARDDKNQTILSTAAAQLANVKMVRREETQIELPLRKSQSQRWFSQGLGCMLGCAGEKIKSEGKDSALEVGVPFQRKEKKILSMKKKKANAGSSQEDTSIPGLSVSNHSSMEALVKSAVMFHPLVAPLTEKSLHPYSAVSVDVWTSWYRTKRFASEWSRASAVKKYLQKQLGSETSYKGEELWSTKKIVKWCRLHGLSFNGPNGKVIPNPNPEADGPKSSSCNQSILASASDFDALHTQFPSELVDDDAVKEDEDIDVVSEEPTVKVDKKKTAMSVRGDLNFEFLPKSEEALFVQDTASQVGVKFLPTALSLGVFGSTAEDMIFASMMEFAADILLKASSVSLSEENKDRPDYSVRAGEVLQAINTLPAARFLTNQHCGIDDSSSEDTENR